MRQKIRHANKLLQQPNTYLHRIGPAETSSCSNGESESQEDIFNLVLDCPVFDSIHLTIFGHSLTTLDLWSRPWGGGLSDYWDSTVLIRALIPRNESSTPTTATTFIRDLSCKMWWKDCNVINFYLLRL